MTPPSKKKTFLDFFPVPEFLLLSTTGIAITDEDTKFVRLRKEVFGDGFELAHATKINNPKGAIESGLINRPNELIPILEKLASHYDLKYAHAVLPEDKAYLFTTTINWVPADGLRDAVAFIIEENAPVSLAESVFDFEIISEDRNAGKIRVAVSVLSQNTVNSYTELFESAGITPVSFKLESQALARAVTSLEEKQPYLIINLSAKKTGFYVVEDGIVQFSITPAYGVNKDEEYSSLSDLRVEMRKVLSFWDAQTDKLGESAPKISKAILCGPGGSKKDFVEKLMIESDLEFSVADVWLNLSSRRHAPDMSLEDSLDYAPAIGLVLPRDK